MSKVAPVARFDGPIIIRFHMRRASSPIAVWKFPRDFFGERVYLFLFSKLIVIGSETFLLLITYSFDFLGAS